MIPPAEGEAGASVTAVQEGLEETPAPTRELVADQETIPENGLEEEEPDSCVLLDRARDQPSRAKYVL